MSCALEAPSRLTGKGFDDDVARSASGAARLERESWGVTQLWCVRAEYGKFADHFIEGEYVAVGWMPETDLSNIGSREELYPLFKAAHPKESGNLVVGQQVGQVARFLLDIRPGDFVVTPAADTEWLYFGEIAPEPPYIFAAGDDGCPYRHRRPVKWSDGRIRRADLSVPMQNTLRSMLTVFSVSQRDEFFEVIGRKDLVRRPVAAEYDAYRVVLEQILELDATEFEVLVGHLLTALGFEGSEVVGKSGDGGVDAIGELNISNLAKVKVFVQAKRYKLGARVPASTVRSLRQAIPINGQGAFITTAGYQRTAADVALEQGFPRIGLVNGHQLVDLLIEHWLDIPEEFRERLGLKPGLVRT